MSQTETLWYHHIWAKIYKGSKMATSDENRVNCSYPQLSSSHSFQGFYNYFLLSAGILKEIHLSDLNHRF